MTRGSATTLFNPNTTPVVCDEVGHIVEGGGRREVDKVDKVGREAVDHGLLVEESGDKPVSDEDQEEQAAPEPKRPPGASAPKKTT